MTPLVIILTLIAGVLILVLPRRYVPVPFFLMASYMTLGQVIMIGPLNFTAMRLLVVFAVVRAFARGDRKLFVLTSLDKSMLVFMVAMIVTGVLLEKNDGFINRLGNTWTLGGIYFTIRLFVVTEEEVVETLKIMSLVIIPIAICMLIEYVTRRNLFFVFGGVPEFTMIRGGKLRCQGAFAHPILAGTAGAICIPQMVYLWIVEKKMRILAIFGGAACLVIVYTSNSSGPIMTCVFACAALMLWSFRLKMKVVQKIIIITLITVQLFMKAPIWFLMSKIDLTGSSTGWHRAALISSALAHLKEWWLCGTTYTRHWMPTGVTWSPNHTDITNYYLHFGVVGGLPTMLAFIFILKEGYKAIGKQMFIMDDNYLKRQRLAWMFGSVLFAHTMTFLSVSYFDQTNVFLYTLFGLIGTLDANRIILERSQTV